MLKFKQDDCNSFLTLLKCNQKSKLYSIQININVPLQNMCLSKMKGKLFFLFLLMSFIFKASLNVFAPRLQLCPVKLRPNNTNTFPSIANMIRNTALKKCNVATTVLYTFSQFICLQQHVQRTHVHFERSITALGFHTYQYYPRLPLCIPHFLTPFSCPIVDPSFMLCQLLLCL